MITRLNLPRPVPHVEDATLTLDQLIQRLEAAMQTLSGIAVTPDTAMESPTVQAIVQAVGGAIATLPIHVLQKTVKDNRTRKEQLPSHPVARLLSAPNAAQDRVTYWLDASSWLVRFANHFAFKARGQTGPIRRLIGIPPSEVQVEQGDDRTTLRYRVGTEPLRAAAEMHHVRGPARNGFTGDSPVMDVREAIALEIAAERYGAAFFGNGAMPGLVFKYVAGSQGHKSGEARREFIEEFQRTYGTTGRRFRALLPPSGIELAEQVPVENDKAQFLETRRLQRNVIAGAFGVPPHLVGDLERGTFSNIEHQSLEFVQRVILRYVRMFEAAMERDLLTPEDRTAGVIIRFNLDAMLRGDFASRQAGLNIQRTAGVINANEWREHEGLNPRDDEGGELYWDKGPSGQGERRTGDDRRAREPEPNPEPNTNGNGRLARRGVV